MPKGVLLCPKCGYPLHIDKFDLDIFRCLMCNDDYAAEFLKRAMIGRQKSEPSLTGLNLKGCEVMDRVNLTDNAHTSGYVQAINK